MHIPQNLPEGIWKRCLQENEIHGTSGVFESLEENIYMTREYMEKAMATHSSSLAWKIPWTEEPGRLQSTGSLGVRHDWATSLSLFTFIGEGNGNPLQYSCLENPRDGGAWWAAVSGVAQSWTRLKRLSSSSSSSKGWIQLRLGHCMRRWGCTWGEGGCVHMLVPTASPWGFLAILLLISGNCSTWRTTEYPGKVLRCFKQSGIWGWGRVFRAEASVSAGAFWKLVSRVTCFYTIFFFSF